VNGHGGLKIMGIKDFFAVPGIAPDRIAGPYSGVVE